jgi:hypothetical protein
MKSHKEKDALMDFLIEKIEETCYKHSPGSPNYRRPYNESPNSRLLGSRSEQVLYFSKNTSRQKSKLYSPRKGKSYGIGETLIKLQPVAPSPRNFTAYTNGNVTGTGEYPQAALLQKLQTSDFSQSPEKKIDLSGSFILAGAVKYKSPPQTTYAKSKISSEKASSELTNTRKIGQVAITEVDSPPSNDHHPAMPGSDAQISKVINRSREPSSGLINVRAYPTGNLPVSQNENMFGSMTEHSPEPNLPMEDSLIITKKPECHHFPPILVDYAKAPVHIELSRENQQEITRLKLETKCQSEELINLRHQNRQLADQAARMQVDKDKLEKQVRLAETQKHSSTLNQEFREEIDNFKLKLRYGDRQSKDMETMLIESESKRIDQLQNFDRVIVDLKNTLEQERLKHQDIIKKKEKDFGDRYSRLVSDLSKERVIVQEFKETAIKAIDLDNLLANKNTQNAELTRNLEKMIDRVEIVKEQRDAAMIREKATADKLAQISVEKERHLLKVQALEAMTFSDDGQNEDKARELLKRVKELESDLDSQKEKTLNLTQQNKLEKTQIESLKLELATQQQNEKTLKDHMRTLLKEKEAFIAKLDKLEEGNGVIENQQKFSEQLLNKVKDLEVNLEKQKDLQLKFKREKTELKSVIKHLKDEAREAELNREEIELELQKAAYEMQVMLSQQKARDANVEELNERVCILQNKLDLTNRDKKKVEYEHKENMNKLNSLTIKLSEAELKVCKLV